MAGRKWITNEELDALEKKQSMLKEFVSYGEAQTLVKVCGVAITKAISEGVLPAQKVGSQFIIKVKDLIPWRRSQLQQQRINAGNSRRGKTRPPQQLPITAPPPCHHAISRGLRKSWTLWHSVLKNSCQRWVPNATA